jgi:acetoin utilization protein AcuB
MIVRFWMSRSPQVATEMMNLYEAIELMRQHRIRRLPVVRGQTLCGIVTLSDLYRFVKPFSLTTVILSEAVVDELSRHTVAEVMTPSPLTCQPNTPLEEVGELMRKNRVGALPVLKDGQLIGIITESDVLSAFVSIARSGIDGKRICFRIPEEIKKEIFPKVVALCQKYEMEILTLLTHPVQEDYLVMLRVRGGKTAEFMQALWEIHYRILIAE